MDLTHIYAHAQALNHSASEFLERGQYDEAIVAITTTLQRWKQCGAADERSCSKNEICGCLHCSGQVRSFQQEREHVGASTLSPSSSSSSSSLSSTTTQRLPQDTEGYDRDTPLKNPAGPDCGYLYDELLQIPCRNHFGNHNVGSAVALILIFNLAIVHHVSALRLNNKTRMKKTLRLYQLANECLNTYVRDTHGCGCIGGDDDTGIVFQMILLNNLSHLHSLMGHHDRSRHCTEQLIPILMCVVDDKTRTNFFQHPVGRNIDVGCMSLEGFFHNVTPLVLTSQCADAA